MSLPDESTLRSVVIKPVMHYSNLVVGIFFNRESDLIAAVKKISGVKFSYTCRCWYVDEKDGLVEEIVGGFRGLARVEVVGLPLRKHSNAVVIREDFACPKEYIDLLVRRRYSEATIRNYCSQFSSFIQFVGKPVGEVKEPDIIGYLDHLVREKKVSISTQNVAINAIKFYFEHVLGEERKIYDWQRPLKESKLPLVLSEEEVRAILNSCENKKHKAMLYMIYAAGLRRGELINLLRRDIDYDRNLIVVRGGKGRKDRITLLSSKATILLHSYLEEYEPKEWLFEGEPGGRYSASSLQKIFKRACRRSGISKPATLHTLRHSFATHLLENGTDIRYIQALLGHNSSRTTEIYAHVTRKGFEKIRSPLDNLDL